MLPYDALVLAKVASQLSTRNDCVNLGVPKLYFDAPIFQHLRGLHLGDTSPLADFTDSVGFFKALGFAEVNALDINDYEGANFIADLNDPTMHQKIGNRQFDLVYDSGTTEHIFDVATALKTIAGMVRVGGAIVHANPTNGFMDHGFWQISPDAYRTFYTSMGFDILTCAIYVLHGQRRAIRVDDNIYRTLGRSYIIENAPDGILVFAARKIAEKAFSNIAMQDYYATMHEGDSSPKPSQFFIEFNE